jgi:transposase
MLAAEDPATARRWQAVLLRVMGETVARTAAITGLSQRQIYEITRHYNAEGAESFVDERSRDGRGRTPLLDAAQQQQLRAALLGPAPDGGLWTSVKVAQWIARETGRDYVAPQRGWDYLDRLGFSLLRPRRTHAEADPVAQEAFKKKLPTVIAEVRAQHPGATVEVWAMDEHTVGLKPVLRRVWAPRGSSPRAWVNPRSQWYYLYAFVEPLTGRTFWLLLPTVSAEAMSVALREFAAFVGASDTRQIVLVLDGAGWHVAHDLVVPPGIRLEFLPPKSPELQPAERLWELTDETIANRVQSDLNEVVELVVARCRALQDDPDRVRAQTLFYWWSQSAAPS